MYERDHHRRGLRGAAGIASRVKFSPTPRELDSHPESRVRNSQPHGIGRVAELGDLVAWNNLGRNIVFADRALKPLSLCDETAFPNDDEPSQFDLDVHAIVRPDVHLVLALNHLGFLRVFRTADIRTPASDRRVRAAALFQFAKDAERCVAAAGRVVASRAPSGPAGGLVISAPIGLERSQGELAVESALESWGQVTALASDGENGIALAAGRRVGLAKLSGGKVGIPRWDVEVPWQTAWVEFEPPLMWVAGCDPPAPGVGDYDWDRLGGGGYSALRLEDGQCLVERRFDRDLAWGNGGVALSLASGTLYGLDRRGALHGFRGSNGEVLGPSAPMRSDSLGIAHATRVGNSVLAGFNRAGYRLFAYSIDGNEHRGIASWQKGGTSSSTR